MNTGLHRGKTTLVLAPALMLDKKKKKVLRSNDLFKSF